MLGLEKIMVAQLSRPKNCQSIFCFHLFLFQMFINQTLSNAAVREQLECCHTHTNKISHKYTTQQQKQPTLLFVETLDLCKELAKNGL